MLISCNQNIKTNPDNESKFTKLSGAYLSQKPPGMIPEIFAPGIVSIKGRIELNAIFSSDYHELYFSILNNDRYEIMVMKYENNLWLTPELCDFSVKHNNVDIFISQDNDRILFCSDRPKEKSNSPFDRLKIWMMMRNAVGWSEPIYLGSKINDGESQIYPSLSKQGNLYFSSERKDGFGGYDVYNSEFNNNTYSSPQNLGPAINSKENEGDAFISPDEKFLIVTCSEREDCIGGADLYISFKNDDNTWGELKNMGILVNSEDVEYCPALTPDGKYFMFSRRNSGNGDIYWVDAKVIEELRSKHLKQVK